MNAPDAMPWYKLRFDRCVELVSATWGNAELSRTSPGSVIENYYASVALHIAPRRWLLLEPNESRLQGLVLSGARCFEQSEKWKVFRFDTSAAPAILSRTTNVEHLLSNRRCARTRLFDCPAVLARFEGAFMVCIESSYEMAWLSALGATTSP
jgi:hypothetical protein